MKKYIRSSLLYSPYYEKWKSFLKENVHGDVPEEVLMQTAEYLGSYGTISLHDAFSEACRDCAPKGSELYKDWYNGDLRKYIPSEYVGASTDICADSNFNPPADSDYGRVLQALRKSGYKPKTSEEWVVMLATDFFEEQGEEFGYNVFTDDEMIDVDELVEYVRDSGGWKEFDYEV